MQWSIWSARPSYPGGVPRPVPPFSQSDPATSTLETLQLHHVRETNWQEHLSTLSFSQTSVVVSVLDIVHVGSRFSLCFKALVGDGRGGLGTWLVKAELHFFSTCHHHTHTHTCTRTHAHAHTCTHTHTHTCTHTRTPPHTHTHTHAHTPPHTHTRTHTSTHTHTHTHTHSFTTTRKPSLDQASPQLSLSEAALQLD